MISMKDGVRIDGLRPEALLGIQIVHSLFQNFDQHLVITSVTDGEHMEGSRHYRGLAFDIRHPQAWDRPKFHFMGRIREALGRDFDVVLEDTHIHIEYDPK